MVKLSFILNTSLENYMELYYACTRSYSRRTEFQQFSEHSVLMNLCLVIYLLNWLIVAELIVQAFYQKIYLTKTGDFLSLAYPGVFPQVGQRGLRCGSDGVAPAKP